MKRELILMGWLFLANNLPARLGVVETLDGHFYKGHIRFESNMVVVADAAKDLLAFVHSTNLAEIGFQKDAALQVEATPAESLWPGPWQNEDVGSVGLPGSGVCAGGLFQLNSSGTNILGQSDAFHFVFKAVKGDSEIVARVVQVQYSAPWAKAGVMMRESLAADSRNVLVAMTRLAAGVFQWREEGAQTTHTDAQRGRFVPHWVKLRRQGNTFTASQSRNGRQWSSAGQVSIYMNEDIFVGLAVAGVDEGTLRPGRPASNRSLIDSVREAPFLPSDAIPIIQLQNGSSVRGRISRADDLQIQVAGAPPGLPIPTSSVARILFRWVPSSGLRKISAGQPGVLLAGGAFIEGDFKRIEMGRVTISSVLLGLRSFDLNNEIAAIVLRKSSILPHHFEVKTVDGSVWLGSDLEIEKDHVLLYEKSLGTRRIAVHELQEVKLLKRRS